MRPARIPLMSRALGAIVVHLLVAGCGGDDSSADAADAGRDAPADAALDTAPLEPSPVRTAAFPIMTPCPSGWRAVDHAGFTECEPWPSSGRAACGAGAAHFPGEAGCRAVAGPCPTSSFASDLPATALHVRPGSVGGDGSEGAPFATLDEAVAVAEAGATIALSSGTHHAALVLRGVSLSIVGACADTVIEADRGAVITAFDSEITLRNLRIRRSFGGLLVGDTRLLVEGVSFEELNDSAINTIRGSEIVVRDVIVRGSRNGAFNVGDANTTVERLVIEDSVDGAMSLRGGRFRGRAIAVSGVSGSVTAFLVSIESDVALSEAVFENDPLVATFVIGGTLALDDSVIRAPLGTGSGSDELGILVYEGASIELSRVVLARARGLGLGITAATAALEDVVIRETLGIGHAIEAGGGSTATLRRIYIDRAGQNGLLIFDPGTSVTATDLRIRDSQPNLAGLGGRGIGVQTGASFDAERVVLEAHHEISFVAASTGTTAVLRDLAVLRTEERPCAATGCGAAGIGLGAYEGALIRVERFEISDNALAGVQIATEGAVDLFDGVVAANPVGVNVQVADYDLGRLSDRVIYRDNGTNLDSEALPVPNPRADSAVSE